MWVRFYIDYFRLLLSIIGLLNSLKVLNVSLIFDIFILIRGFKKYIVIGINGKYRGK